MNPRNQVIDAKNLSSSSPTSVWPTTYYAMPLANWEIRGRSLQRLQFRSTVSWKN